jgi:hypothetical protein
MKTSAEGCNASYVCSDNQAFFVSLYRELIKGVEPMSIVGEVNNGKRRWNVIFIMNCFHSGSIVSGFRK